MLLLLPSESRLGIYVARVVRHFPFNVIVDIAEHDLLTAPLILGCKLVLLADLIFIGVDYEVCVHLAAVVHHILLLEFLRLIEDSYNIK